MGGPATDESVARLIADPSALAAEIARYTELKAQVESKMRAVVDEASANELLVNATKKLAEAEDVLHRATLEAEGTLARTMREAQGVRDGALADAEKIRSEAESAARDTLAQAEDLRKDAAARAGAVSDAQSAAERAIASATAAKMAADARADEYRTAYEEASALRARLSEASKQIIAALGA